MIQRQIQVVNEVTGIPFNVKVVKRGESYGRGGCLTHDRDDALVEFYDARYEGKYEDWDNGQFVSRYFTSTLLEDETGGLCLDGGVRDWFVTDDNMRQVRNFIKIFV
jgi:hypothetical protein